MSPLCREPAAGRRSASSRRVSRRRRDPRDSPGAPASYCHQRLCTGPVARLDRCRDRKLERGIWSRLVLGCGCSVSARADSTGAADSALFAPFRAVSATGEAVSDSPPFATVPSRTPPLLQRGHARARPATRYASSDALNPHRPRRLRCSTTPASPSSAHPALARAMAISASARCHWPASTAALIAALSAASASTSSGSARGVSS